MAEEQHHYLAVLKASYDYEPQSEDEVAVKEDQILFLLEKIDEDWWKVKIKPPTQEDDSPSGLVPAAYVEQAEHSSTVKALYDYEATAPGELTIKEDERLLVFEREGEWVLVQKEGDGGAGFVPGNYVEELGEESEAAAPAPPQIVVPPSPEPAPRPTSVYVDPADRVASAPTKAQADDIKTWSVSEVNEKGKKKKGTLGIGNGSLFFASESDKTPVRKWPTADIADYSIEKSKHVHIDITGLNPVKLHFNVGSKDTAEAVVSKLVSSKELSSGQQSDVNEGSPSSSPHKKNGVSVRFAEESPAIIPPREESDEEEEEEEYEEPAAASATDEGEGEMVFALYDFEGTSEDELSVTEGEKLWIVEKEGDEWWKCRNEHGAEGVVPASYLENIPGQGAQKDDSAAREAEARAKAEEEERKAREKAERAEKAEKAERERKVQEEQRAKAAAAAAEQERRRREKEEETRAAEARRKERQVAARKAQEKADREKSRSPPPASQSKSRNSSESSTSKHRSSSDNRRFPDPNSTRVWHDRSGQFRVEAAFLGYKDGKLRLHKSNGVVIEVPSEKMSVEDMRYVEKLIRGSQKPSSPPRKVSNDDDDEPLALKRQAEAAKRASTAPAKKGPTIDWFEFFLNAGCDIDDCTRYASSFERDKIDEALLPDITESTMRSLGLREGDIIRVTKFIAQKYGKKDKEEQVRKDQELAEELQREESKPTNPAPNLFAGPGGVLKNNTQRRGRPQPSKSLPPASVDLNAIESASGQIQRTGSPAAMTPQSTTAVQPPQRASSAAPVASGFDDDAWTNRPSSTKPSSSTPTTSTAPARAPSAPPVATQVATQAAPTPPPAPAVAPTQSDQPKSVLAKTDADIFDQLARLSALNTNRAVPSPAPATAPSPSIMAPLANGMGIGSSPSPMGQHLQAQQTGMPPNPNAPRGPFAPVPANQGLLQPLVPTTTGFNGFVPARTGSAHLSPFANPSPIQPQPTSFMPQQQPPPMPQQGLMVQPTGFPGASPMMAQPTGAFGNFGTFNSNVSPFQNGGMQPQPTGFNPNFGNFSSNTSPPPSSPFGQNNNTQSTNPANVFASMKSGTFTSGDDMNGPQQAEKYDVLRAQPTGFNGWGGYQPNGGFQSGYTGY